jgi:MFS family permease
MPHPSHSELAASPGPWQPLRNATFRNLLASNLISDIGTFMQSVGAAWLMTSLTNSSLYIALIQTATALPFFLLALPAGSVGDIFDRRKLILGMEIWMLSIAVVLTVTTISGAMTPWLLRPAAGIRRKHQDDDEQDEPAERKAVPDRWPSLRAVLSRHTYPCCFARRSSLSSLVPFGRSYPHQRGRSAGIRSPMGFCSVFWIGRRSRCYGAATEPLEDFLGDSVVYRHRDIRRSHPTCHQQLAASRFGHLPVCPCGVPDAKSSRF